jgi:hypothetical protein
MTATFAFWGCHRVSVEEREIMQQRRFRSRKGRLPSSRKRESGCDVKRKQHGRTRMPMRRQTHAFKPRNREVSLALLPTEYIFPDATCT